MVHEKVELLENVELNDINGNWLCDCDIDYRIAYDLNDGNNVTSSSIDIIDIKLLEINCYDKNGWPIDIVIPPVHDIKEIIEDYVDSHYQDIIWQ